jgi:outer membrane lipoprotein-sorting protein
MNARIGAMLAALALAAPWQAGLAQDAKKGTPPNPVGAMPAWNQTVSKDTSVVGEQLDKKQVELVQKVSGYFNQMGDMKGLFVQTNADNKRSRGKFYVKRPGRFRFDYGAPSKLVIISDGKYLAIQDFDLKTDDRIALDSTPFRVLMRKDVDLLRDAHVLEVQEIDDVIVVLLEDRNTDNPGRIKLFLGKKPTLELKEWITTDPQGLDTRVELHEMSKADDLDPNLFNPSLISSQKVLQ